MVNQGPWILSGEQRSKTFHEKSLEHVPEYSYGAAEVARSAVSVMDLENLKTSAGFTEEDQRYLRLAGEVLADQTKQIVNHWRGGIIATIPTRQTLSDARGDLSRNTSRPAIPVFRNGFWTPACGPTIRSGEFRRRGGADALDMVQVGADTTCALDRPLQVTPSRYQTSGDLCAVHVERLSICVKIRSNISA